MEAPLPPLLLPSLPALPSSEHKLQVPGRPLICFAVQKAQSTGFPFLFPSLKLKWGSVSRHEGREGEGAGRKRSLCKRDPAEGKSTGGFRWAGATGTQGLWGCQNPCFLITEFFWCAWISLILVPSPIILYSFSSSHVLFPPPQHVNQWRR